MTAHREVPLAIDNTTQRLTLSPETWNECAVMPRFVCSGAVAAFRAGSGAPPLAHCASSRGQD